MSDFIVRIDSSKLSAKQANQLASAIQGTVLSEIGRLDLAPLDPHGISGALTLHPEWRGLWLRSLKDLQNPGAPPILQVNEKIAAGK